MPDHTMAPRQEIAFVNANLADLETLIAGMRPDIEIVILDPAGDGFAQIARTLDGRSNLDAIHLLGHGAAGMLELGDVVVDAAYLKQHADVLAEIGAALHQDGDILLYGCDTGAGSAGADFLQTLAQATGADVAASDDATGGAAAGGDWQLEIAAGQIDSGTAFADGAAWSPILALSAGTVHTYSQNTWAFSSLAKDAAGNIFLAHKLDQTAIAIKQWTGAAWTTVTTLTTAMTGDTSFSDDLSLRVDAAGNLDLLFRHAKDVTSSIDSMRGIKFGEFDMTSRTWTTTTIDEASHPNGARNYNDPVLSMSPDGTLHAVYNYAHTWDPVRDYTIKYATSTNGGASWTTSTILTTNSATDELKTPTAFTDANGTVHLFYVREDSQNTYYGNLYYATKAAGSASFGTATKIADNLTSAFTMTSDGNGHFYIGYSLRTTNPDNSVSGSKLNILSNESGAWATETVLQDARANIVGGLQLANGKLHMLVNSRALDNSATDIYVMRDDGAVWQKGFQGEARLPLLSTQSSTEYFSERTFMVKDDGSIMVLAQDGGTPNLRNIYFTTGSSADFGLVSNVAPTIGELHGDATDFTPGVDPVLEGAYIDDQMNSLPVIVSDADSSDFAGGQLSITRSSGTANGQFVFDAANSGFLAFGADSASAGGSIHAGDMLFLYQGGSWTAIGQVDGIHDGQAGRNLVIAFSDAGATPARVQELIANLLFTAPTPGQRVFSLTVSDGDGATSNPVSFTMNGRDVVAPTVTNITSTTADGAYKAGAAILIQVQFSEAVYVTGAPTLLLDNGGVATRVGGNGSNTLVFSYTVQQGQVSADLDVAGTGALQLNGGAIKDGAGNDAVLTLATPGAAGSLGANKAIRVDGAAPTDIVLSNAAITTLDGANAVVGNLGSVDANTQDSFTYSLVSGDGSTDNAAFAIVGGTLRALDAGALGEGVRSVRVRSTDAAGNTYEEALSIAVSSPPTVAITAAQNSLGVGGSTLVTFTFSKTPVGFAAADVSVTGGSLGALTADPQNDKVYTATFTPDAGVQNLAATISVGAGAFTDAGGLANVASTVNAAIGGDTLAPAVTSVSASSANGSYKLGDTIAIQLSFSEAVTVTGQPGLQLDTGATDRIATYSGGSGTNTISFSYTVQAGDLSADLDLAGTASLLLGGGSIRDALGNDASLTLPAPGAAGSLGANKAIRVDGAAPTDIVLSNAAITTLDGANAVVGNLGSVDANTQDSFTYSLVSGDGSTDNAAFAIVGGTLRALDAGALGEGVKSVRVRSTDAAGNTYEEALAIAVSSPPTVAITAAQNSLGVGGSTLVTFTFSKTPVGFAAADVSVTGGSLGALTADPQNDKVYTATFTPDAGAQNLAATISVGAGAFTDAGGLANIASAVNAAIGGDTLAPSVVIGSDRGTFRAGEQATVSFTFNETPTGFGIDDITVTGGTLSNLAVTSDSKVYTATFTPTAGIDSLSGAIGVAGARFVDAAGNANAASLPLTIGGDTLAPNVSAPHIGIGGASGADGSFVTGDTVTVTWNDGPDGDRNADTAAVSVDFSAFGGPAAAAAVLAGGVWSASYQVTAGSIDAGNRNVAVTVTDNAGNSTTRVDGANASVDNQAPSVSAGALALSGATGSGGAYRVGDVVTATWNNASDANADVANVQFDFSQFGGGTVAGSASGATWSASYTIVAADIDAGNRNVAVSVTDDAGQVTQRSGAANVWVDAILPHVTAISVAGNPPPDATGIDFTVVFDEAVSGLDLGDFVLGTGGSATGTLAGISGSGTTWTVSVSGISGNGSLELGLKTGGTGIADGAGNMATAGYDAGAAHAVTFNAAPVIGSNGGGATAALSVAEKQRAVTTVSATDAESHAITYAIAGGSDAALFEIDAATGVLRFIATPSHAQALDSDRDHVYEVTVSAQDGHGAIDNQALSVTVLADLDGDGIPDQNDNDIDNDGRPNSTEDPVPGAHGGFGDGNGDGMPDSSQLNVASLPTVAAGAPFATLEVAPGLSLGAVSSIPAANGLPRHVKMPVGQFDFTIGGVTPGGTVEVSIYVDSAYKVNGYYKLDASNNWVNLAAPVTTVGSKTKVTFSLTDGGMFDADGVVNGSITDPGGLVVIGPVITSNGGLPIATLGLTEGATAVTTVQAGEGVSYAITGGADAALFTIDAATGALRFISAPSFGAALDTGADNVYDVNVSASNAFGTDTQSLAVRVDAAAPPTTVIDGVSVGTGTRSNADGSISQVITIPVVVPTRSESVGNNDVADIPLVSSGGATVLGAQVPVGVGLQVTGSGASGVADAITNLIREIKGVTQAGSHDQAQMTGGGSGFLSSLPANANLLVQTVVPTVAPGATAATGPLVIQGAAPSTGAPLSALVIDAQGLPSGSTIELQNVDFAAIVGAVRVTGGAGSQTVWGDGASQTIILGADDDVLHGGAGNDIVGSAGGNDKIYGDEGDDIVFGGLGDDLVDGGSGIDTVQLVGSGRADYVARFVDGHLVLAHRNGGADGTDTIANVEVLRFTSAAADTSARGSIERLYEAVLGREADAAGVDAWLAALGRGASLADVARHMLASGEAQLQAGGDADFVSALYSRSLERGVDAGGLQHWTGVLASGALTRAELALHITDSAEKLARPAVQDLALGDSDIGALVRMYATLFDRAPDSAGMNHWLSLSEAGVSLDRIADHFLASSEAQASYGALDNQGFTQALYQHAMHRTGSDVEVAYWTELLDSGALDRGDVLLQFAGSTEKVELVGVIGTSLDGAGML
ncbi:Ig-like domain-containing protein [Massilia sp. BHUDP2]|uniref:Ig-like domain-containing protein n=1 Tax=Massilia sp. BHUDP2 TaxID=3034505 RepID=UPI003905A4E3